MISLNKMEVFDIETLRDENDNMLPHMIGISNKNKVMTFVSKNSCADEIFDFMYHNMHTKTRYYAHNLTFDAMLVIKPIVKSNSFVSWVNIDNVIYSLTFNNSKGEPVECYCSYRLTMQKLSNLTNNKTPLPYGNLKLDYSETYIAKESDFNSKKDYDEWVLTEGVSVNFEEACTRYMCNDILITKKFMIEYMKVLHDVGIKIQWGLSASSLSVNTFFKLYKTKVLKNMHKSVDLEIRKAYYGGRTEVFGNARKSEKTLHFDFSGMYAQVLKEKFPSGKPRIVHNIETPKGLIETPGFYYITYVQHSKIPILPIKLEKLYFMNGELEGLYWFEEINLAIEHKAITIKNVERAVLFDYYDYEFSDFIEKNNKIREISPVYKLLGKLLNNSFYGGLGIDKSKKKCLYIKNKEHIESEINENSKFHNKYKKINENLVLSAVYDEINVYELMNTKSNKITNVSISAAVTAKARIKLYKGFVEVENSGGRLLYCDTDSIFAAYPINVDVENKQMGDVIFDTNLDDTVICESRFSSAKTYCVNYINGTSKSKIKGFSGDISMCEFKEAFSMMEVMKNNKSETYYSLEKHKSIGMYLDKEIVMFDDFVKSKNLKSKKMRIDLLDGMYKYDMLIREFNINKYNKRLFINSYETIPRHTMSYK